MLSTRLALSKSLPFPVLETLCRELETQSGGRLGVYLFDGRNDKEFLYRGHERFPMCSTFKWLAAAAVLGQVDMGRDRLDRQIRFRAQDVLDYSPVTRSHADGPGLSIVRLCEAAIADSDNTAANLLLDAIGGLSGFNAFLRQHGDATTRLDRYEPALNEARTDDVRDTTSPVAMGADLRRLLLGDGLSAASRRQLTDWMLATRTSGKRLRAGLKAGWSLADKTGTGYNGTANDVGVYWTPDGKPIVLCIYLTTAQTPLAAQESVIARLGERIRKD
ncbi:class A beta-lactamase [Uliginosibacterium sp. 31-16]|uniref:class A beta-lactamase n=1 Tax=Uliginosibacterium sp. 31-16 TaxID=3068315 RepID=UPI00273DBE4E|nr:class A beta-lactamase [Uliginosibacterium sp. 31-16]MDP5238537.1 class A beta-lactamase [Uliginosibacterium sp. 31-16]